MQRCKPISSPAAALFAFALTAAQIAFAASSSAQADLARHPTTAREPGSWKRFSTSHSAKTEAPNQSWYNLAWDSKRNVAYGLSWDGMLSAFDPTKARWSDVARLGSTTDTHNRTTTYDPVNDYVWVTDGTGGFQGLRYLNLGTMSWHLHSNGGPSYQSAVIFDPAGKRLVAFGGWTSPTSNVRTLALDPIGARWIGSTLPNGPRFTSDTQKMTAQRSAFDPVRSRILYVDTDGSLWALLLSPFEWQQIATTGPPPPARTQFVYDAARDALVGWSASPNIAAGENLSGSRRETWLLPLSTLAWSKHLSPNTDLPPETVYVGYSLVYDPVRQQTILHTLSGTSNWSPETWAFRSP